MLEICHESKKKESHTNKTHKAIYTPMTVSHTVLSDHVTLLPGISSEYALKSENW